MSAISRYLTTSFQLQFRELGHHSHVNEVSTYLGWTLLSCRGDALANRQLGPQHSMEQLRDAASSTDPYRGCLQREWLPYGITDLIVQSAEFVLI